MKIDIPAAMKSEHDELHADLVKATKSGGETAQAAKAVAHVLHGHFVGEEEFAMPPLGAPGESRERRVQPRHGGRSADDWQA